MINSPWQLLGNLTAWSLIVILVLLMALIAVSIIVSTYRTIRTKRMMQASRDRRTTVFASKRQDWWTG